MFPENVHASTKDGHYQTAYNGDTAEYPATIVPDSTCAHIFEERDMCRNKLTQVAGYSAVN